MVVNSVFIVSGLRSQQPLLTQGTREHIILSPERNNDYWNQCYRVYLGLSKITTIRGLSLSMWKIGVFPALMISIGEIHKNPSHWSVAFKWFTWYIHVRFQCAKVEQNTIESGFSKYIFQIHKVLAYFNYFHTYY